MTRRGRHRIRRFKISRGIVLRRNCGRSIRLRRHRRGATFVIMRYLSTRDAGKASAARSFEDVLLAGLAEDGGLYVPERLPALGRDALCDLAGMPYAEIAARIVGLFAAGSFTTDELRALTARAYGGFAHAAVTPLVQVDERLWLL